MPNASGHLAVAECVADKLKIMDSDFIKGNLLPDLIKDKSISHYRIQGTKYLIPDMKRVKEDLDFKDKTNLGVLTHLLLDLYFNEDYVTIKYPDFDVFADGRIYQDYDILNRDVIAYFHLDVEKLEKILREITNPEYQEKLQECINYLHLDVKGNPQVLQREEYLQFLEEVSTRIAEEIKKYI